MKLFQSSQDCLKTSSVLLQKIISISKEEAFVFLSLLKIALTYLESLIIFIVQITFCLLEEFKLIHVQTYEILLISKRNDLGHNVDFSSSSFSSVYKVIAECIIAKVKADVGQLKRILFISFHYSYWRMFGLGSCGQLGSDNRFLLAT